MSLHISATTALDRLPVAVSGRPTRSIACRRRIRVLRATGEAAAPERHRAQSPRAREDGEVGDAGQQWRAWSAIGTGYTVRLSRSAVEPPTPGGSAPAPRAHRGHGARTGA